MQIVIDLRLPLRARPGLVDILDAEQKRSAMPLGEIMREHGRIGVAKVQWAGRRWGEAGGESHDFSMT
jgi:hypothetical protein